MNNVFRKKSMDRISSPEQLNDYIRVSNPGVWMALVAIVLLLIGVCVWGIFGRMDTGITAVAIVDDGSSVCYVKEENISEIKVGQTVRIKGKEYVVASVSEEPIAVSKDMDSYALHIGSLSVGEWVYEVNFTTELSDGIYEGQIVIESVSPMSFLVN